MMFKSCLKVRNLLLELEAVISYQSSKSTWSLPSTVFIYQRSMITVFCYLVCYKRFNQLTIGPRPLRLRLCAMGFCRKNVKFSLNCSFENDFGLSTHTLFLVFALVVRPFCWNAPTSPSTGKTVQINRSRGAEIYWTGCTWIKPNNSEWNIGRSRQTRGHT